MIGIALGGGGTCGDFEVGALLYLYEQGIRPDVICGTSVGAIGAAKLAEGEGGPNQGLQGLRSLWLGMRRNEDMYVPDTWLQSIDPELRAILLEGADPGTVLPTQMPSMDDHAAWGDLAVVVWGVNLAGWFIGDLLAKLIAHGGNIVEAVQGLLETKAIYNLGPIQAKLATGLDPALVERWSSADPNRPKLLRISTVSLGTGRLRYITETGAMLERDNRTPVLSSLPPPACTAIANQVSWLQEQIVSLGEEQSAHIRDTRRPSPILAAELRAAQDQLEEQRSALATCLATTLPPPATTDLRTGAIASASMPGVFPSVTIAGDSYTDGGVRESVPIQAALDLGANTVYAVAASPVDLVPSGPFPTAISVVGHSLIEIALNEIQRNETHPPGGWGGRTVHVIQPTLSAELPEPVHDNLTIDPGLISIAIDYGYMRAADVTRGVPPSHRLWQIADAITATRKRTWALECRLHGQPVPPNRTATLPADRSVLSQIEANRQHLRTLIAERRQLGGPLPASADNWPLQAERHPWLGRIPRLRVEPPSQPLGTPTQVTVFASDAAGSPVAGEVTVNGQSVGRTNAAFTHTFTMNRVREFDPETRSWRIDLVSPVGKVLVPEYDPTDVPFDLYDPASRISDAAFVGQSVPSTMVTGERYNVSVRMRNTGTTTWSPGGANPFRLGSQNPTDNSTWGTNRLALPATVSPGAEATFAFTVTAPAPGTQRFQWQMVQEMVQWFGARTPDTSVQVVTPTLQTSVTPYPVPFNTPVQVTVRATRNPGGSAVAGQVLINGSQVAATNTPFTYTFRMRIIGRTFDPETRIWINDFGPPTVIVRASGFPDATVDLGA